MAYTIGVVVFAFGRRDSLTRALWTTGIIALIAHFICAYQFFHSWSHDSAYLDTARQTEEVVGLNWGGGLFINYAFLTAWIVDVGWWWLKGLPSYRARPWSILALWHGFMVFILFNAMVVFKDGTVRWIGLCISIVLCISYGYFSTTKTPGTQRIDFVP